MNIMKQKKRLIKKRWIKKLSNKFKELKSLIYEYRDRKEDEIKYVKSKP